MADNKGGTGVLDQKSGTGKGQQGKVNNPDKLTAADLNTRADSLLDMLAAKVSAGDEKAALFKAVFEGDQTGIEECVAKYRSNLLNTVVAGETLAGTDPTVCQHYMGGPRNGRWQAEAILGGGEQFVKLRKQERKDRKAGKLKIVA